MLRQIEWRLQNGCTNDPNVHIPIFRKRWSLILGSFFPVSILNELKFKKKIVPVMHISVRHGISYNFSSGVINVENKDKKTRFL